MKILRRIVNFSPTGGPMFFDGGAVAPLSPPSGANSCPPDLAVATQAVRQLIVYNSTFNYVYREFLFQYCLFFPTLLECQIPIDVFKLPKPNGLLLIKYS